MPVRSIVVTGADGPIGRRVTAKRDDAAVLASWPDADLEGTRRALLYADDAATVVYLSSAVVYGAWPDNPVPITEEAPLRPNPAIDDAARHAEAERLVADWADDHPGATVAILRPATVLGPGVDSWLARTPRFRADGADPARQFVHIDDVVSAIEVATERSLDGVFNVAADGSIPGEVVRGLSAGRLSLPVPALAARMLTRWASALGLSNVSPDVLPLIDYPWVVANDRLRAAGWEPQYSNEEAVVAGRPGGWWREMSPGRRQQLTLGAAGALAAGAVAAVAGIIGTHRRNRSS
jgi:nucleoside-diphosphate-sugar epimerase